MTMATQKGADKWKQKKWFVVQAPKSFEGKTICEIPANDEKSVYARNIRVALSQLTGDPGHAFANVTLKVSGVSGNTVQTQITDIQQLNSYLRSLVRRGRSVADCVLPLKTGDGTEVVLKMIAITGGRTAHSNIKILRKAMGEFLTPYVREREFDQLVKLIIDGRMQAELGAKLQRIVQIYKVEVKRMEVVLPAAEVKKQAAAVQPQPSPQG